MSNLYKVSVKCIGTYSSCYVVAEDPTEAYEKYRNYLNKKDILYNDERKLASIILIAEESEYQSDKDLPLLFV